MAFLQGYVRNQAYLVGNLRDLIKVWYQSRSHKLARFKTRFSSQLQHWCW